MEPNWAPTLRTHLQEQLERSQTPGFAIALARAGELRFAEGVGHRDREARLPYTLDTMNGLASIGKSFTAIAILQLQEEGRLSLHDPVIRYIPQFRTPDPAATDAITLHHLLTHTSGLPDLPFLTWAFAPSIMADPSTEGTHWRRMAEGAQPLTTMAEHLRLLAEYPYQMLGAPGELTHYSNDGYALLGYVIEALSGRTYDEYITERIARPAGLQSFTTDAATAQSHPEVATRYAGQMQDGQWQIVRAPLWWEDPVLRAGGGAHNATARDLLRFAELFRTGGLIDGVRLLQPESVVLMMHPHAPMPPDMAYGYGLLIQTDFHGTPLIGHTGNVKGAATFFGLLPEYGLTVTVSSNYVAAPVHAIAHAALRLERGLRLDEPVAPYPEYHCPPEQLAAYAGTYPGHGAPLEVRVEEGRLLFNMGGQVDPCRPVGPHTFVLQLPQEEAPIAFLTDTTGRPYALQLGTRVRLKA